MHHDCVIVFERNVHCCRILLRNIVVTTAARSSEVRVLIEQQLSRSDEMTSSFMLTTATHLSLSEAPEAFEHVAEWVESKMGRNCDVVHSDFMHVKLNLRK